MQSNCYRFKLAHGEHDIENRFNARFIKEGLFKSEIEINGLKSVSTPIIRTDDAQSIHMLSWGLLGSEEPAGHQRPALHTNIEDIKTNRSFKNGIANRCLVLMDGFYEWQFTFPDRSNSKRIKYLVTNETGGLFATAGLFHDWINPKTGQIDYCYTILTTQANKMMKIVHNKGERMLLVLDRGEEAAWLDPGNDYLNFADRSHVTLRAVSTVPVQQNLFAI